MREIFPHRECRTHDPYAPFQPRESWGHVNQQNYYVEPRTLQYID